MLHRKVANIKFGEKDCDLRKKNTLTQDELAKYIGVSKQIIIGWERDGRYPHNIETLEKWPIYSMFCYIAGSRMG
ncbi:helix-turn-helix transcriptional regulator [uncultured Sharpea sp.]|uniref:helix-turn-helix transcriptional regulator n=1 Tax=uncultured Sharpea sp. TaxID=1112738 RepID=UPI00338E3912